MSRELIPFDPEIERTLRALRKQNMDQMTNNTERINMEEDTATNERPRKLKDYHTSSTEGYGPSIVRPPIGQNNFELKPNFISMIQNHVQFYGLPHETRIST